MSSLDGAGRGNAQIFSAPLSPSVVGLSMHFAYALAEPWDFASNPVLVGVAP
jgi:hypothetical protein